MRTLVLKKWVDFSPGDRIVNNLERSPMNWFATVMRYEEWRDKRLKDFPQHDKAYYDELFDLVNDLPIKLDEIYYQNVTPSVNTLYCWGRKKGWHIIESCVHEPLVLLTSTICNKCGKTLRP
jgi:hypothetical protein